MGAGWEKLYWNQCDMSGKRLSCTREKKVVSLQLYWEWVLFFPSIKNNISVPCTWKYYSSLLLFCSYLLENEEEKFFLEIRGEKYYSEIPLQVISIIKISH